MATHPVFLPGESHGQRSLGGYSIWIRKELNMTEQLTISLFSFQMELYGLQRAFSCAILSLQPL